MMRHARRMVQPLMVGTESWQLRHTYLSLTSPRREVEWNLLEMTFRYVLLKWVYFKISKISLLLMLRFFCGSAYMLFTVANDNDLFFLNIELALTNYCTMQPRNPFPLEIILRGIAKYFPIKLKRNNKGKAENARYRCNFQGVSNNICCSPASKYRNMLPCVCRYELTYVPLLNTDVHSNSRRVMPPNFVKGSNEYPNQVFLKLNLVVILICICVVICYIINCNCFIKI